jgi:hypothetical protein
VIERAVIALRCVLGIAALLYAAAAPAHEVRPAYLELRETVPSEFTVLFKTPRVGDARLALTPRFGGGATALTPVVARLPPGAVVQGWTLHAPALRGASVAIDGLSGTMTDALVRVEFLDGTSWTHRLRPGAPHAVVPERGTALGVAGVYAALGVEHILAGVDHLLFVLALLIVARGGWRLVATVTAFTLAHSITLALATLGLVHLPTPPIEAIIALSIAFVAAEIVCGQRGAPTGLTARAPWSVAFGFGLLHGLGFAGALAQLGLPEGRIPLALLAFNLGVEAGQLLFIAAVLGAASLLRRFVTVGQDLHGAPRLDLGSRRWRLGTAYAIGSVASFWVIQRIAAF